MRFWVFWRLLAPVKQQRFALGIIRREALQADEILGPHPTDILDLDRLEAGLAINDKIHFHARTRPPIINLRMGGRLALGAPGKDLNPEPQEHVFDDLHIAGKRNFFSGML